MANDYDITSANAICVLTVDNLYPSGIQIQNFATDSSFATSDITVAEVRMGVDGHLAAGYVPSAIDVTLSIEASSPCLEQLQNIIETQQRNKSALKCSMQITIPSRGKEYQLSNGFLLTGHMFPDGKKVLDPTNWQFTFETCKSSSI